MQLNSNAISQIDKVKNEFQEDMKSKMVTDVFRSIVTCSIPLKNGEKEKLDNPDFKAKLNEVLSDVSKDMINKFDNVSQFDTGNLFTSMITSISDSVSLEANYRQEKLFNLIRLGKIDQSSTESLNTAIHNVFADRSKFESKEIDKRWRDDMKQVMAREAADEVIDKIKNDVKDAIDETEAKNDLVEGTTQEIIDYKEEIAPPDDEYQDPNDQTPVSEEEPVTDDSGIADVGDDGLAGEDSGDTDEPIYEGDEGTAEEPTTDENTNVGGDPTSNGEENDSAPDDTGDTNEIGGEEGLGEDGTGETEDLGLENPDDNGEVGGADGVIDQGDVGKTVEDPNAGMEPVEPSAPAVSDGNSNNNSGGITININGADLKATKEALNLYNPISLASKRVPLHPKMFNNIKLPDVNSLSAEMMNAGEGCNEEFKNRLDGLRYANRQVTEENLKTSVESKINEYGKIIGESLTNAKNLTKSLEGIGLTVNGLIYSNEATLCIARNIINRFLMKKQFVSPVSRPYTSKENIIANAFDIVQLRQHLDKQSNPNTEEVNDLISRENLFYHNMINYNDPEIKKQATGIIDLSLMNFKKAMSPNFITDYKIKAWELNVGDKSNKEINEEVVKRVKDKFEKLWMRELNADEIKIIRGAANQEDVTELTPTPYEKFMITMTKECLLSHGSEDPISGAKLTKDEKRNIEWKSRLMTTVYKTAEAFGAFNSDDNSNFEKFTNMIGI